MAVVVALLAGVLLGAAGALVACRRWSAHRRPRAVRPPAPTGLGAPTSSGLQLLDATPVPVSLVDRAGVVTWVNAAHARALGTRAGAQDPAVPLAASLPALDAAWLAQLVEAVADGVVPATTVATTVAGPSGIVLTARSTLATAPAGAGAGDGPGVLVVVDDVTSQRAAERALTEAEMMASSIVSALSEGVVVLGPDGLVRRANDAAGVTLGLPSDLLLGASAGSWLPEPRRADLTPVPHAELPDVVALATGDPCPPVQLGLTVDGATRWVLVGAVPILRFGDLGPAGVVCSLVDVTERVVAERNLAVSEARLRATADGAFDSFYLSDAVRDADGAIVDFRVVDVNRRGALRLGGTPRQVIGRTMREIQGDAVNLDVIARCAHAVETGTPWEQELRVPLGGGFEQWVAYHAVPIGESLAVTTRDVTDRRQAEDALRRSEADAAHRAHHDPLTGLANRSLLVQRLDPAARAGRDAVLLFIDLDGFKPVNDRYGHDAGDAALVEVARRLKALVRTEDLVVRHGGDEFVVLLDPAPALADAVRVGARFVEELGLPMVLTRGEEATLGASVGLACGDGTVSGDELLHRADTAAYRAKAAGRGCLFIDDGSGDDVCLMGSRRSSGSYPHAGG